MTDPTSVLAWLAERPHLLRSNKPTSTDACACGRCTVLVVLNSPSGPYALCPGCLGRDLEPRQTTPTTIPTTRRKATK